MSIIVINPQDSLSSTKTRVNELSEAVGDVELLSTEVTADVVSAINSVDQRVDSNLRRANIRALAIS